MNKNYQHLVDKFVVSQRTTNMCKAYINDFSIVKDRFYLFINASNVIKVSQPEVLQYFGWGKHLFYTEYQLIDIELMCPIVIKLYISSSQKDDGFDSWFKEFI